MMAKSDNSGIGTNETVEPDELRQWAAQKGMADDPRCTFVDADKETDGIQTVWSKFADANPYQYTAGMPMVYDKWMKVREISGTYEWDEFPKASIEECLAEEFP